MKRIFLILTIISTTVLAQNGEPAVKEAVDMLLKV
jgi:hypothetical protein